MLQEQRYETLNIFSEKKYYGHNPIYNILIECEEFEEYLDSSIFMESEKKQGIINRLISSIKKLITRTKEFINDKLRKIYVDQGTILVKKEILKKWDKFITAIKKFLAKPVEFVQKHPVSSQLVVFITTFSIIGLIEKKNKDISNSTRGYGYAIPYSRKGIREMIKEDEECIKKCEQTIKDIENNTEHIFYDKNGRETVIHGLDYDQKRRKYAGEAEISYRKNRIEAGKKWDISLFKYACTLLKQIIVKLQQAATEFFKAFEKK